MAGISPKKEDETQTAIKRMLNPSARPVSKKQQAVAQQKLDTEARSWVDINYPNVLCVQDANAHMPNWLFFKQVSGIKRYNGLAITLTAGNVTLTSPKKEAHIRQLVNNGWLCYAVADIHDFQRMVKSYFIYGT